MATNAVEQGITVSGNPFDLNDEEAEALLALEYEQLAKALRTEGVIKAGPR